MSQHLDAQAIDLRVAGDRIERLLDELRLAVIPREYEHVEEVVRLVTELYGAGLERMLEIVGTAAPELLGEFADDDLVASLLVVHDLHPDDLDHRVEEALESVRPFLRHHDGDVELLDIDAPAGAVHLRLLGSCDGCPSSSVTLQLAVEKAISEAAPEIVIIDVEAHDPELVPAGSYDGTSTPVALGRKRVYDECPSEVSAVGRAVSEVATDPVRAAAGPLEVLSRIRQATSAQQDRAGERCEVCAEVIGEEHGHLVDLEGRALRCACRGCYLLFAPDGAGGNRFRAVPERYLTFSDFRLTAAQWDALQVPVSVAFFFLNSTLERVAAFYPSPAGATESLLPLETWGDLVDANPALATLQPDVEAFLVRSERGGDAPECYLVPIDVCYELVGELRTSWRGFDGGAEAVAGLARFFERVRSRAHPFDAEVN